MAYRRSRIFLAAALPGLCTPLQATERSGDIALTTDYVFRGLSQSDGSVAWQAGARIDGVGGLYGSVLASRVHFSSEPRATAEIDYVAGVHHALGDDWTGDVNATWFTHAGAPGLNYLEWVVTATWRDRRWVMAGVSDDVFATGRSGMYAQAGFKVPLNTFTHMEFAGGYYLLDRAYGRSYAHAQATIAWQLNSRFEMRLAGHLTDENARELFGNLAGSRLEASLQASF